MMDEYSTCCDCGSSWPTGTDGRHSCTEKLLATNKQLHKRGIDIRDY